MEKVLDCLSIVVLFVAEFFERINKFAIFECHCANATSSMSCEDSIECFWSWMQVGKERLLPKAFHLLFFRNIMIYESIGLLTYFQFLCSITLLEAFLTYIKSFLEERRYLVHFPVCLLRGEEEALLIRSLICWGGNGIELESSLCFWYIIVHNVLVLFIRRCQLPAGRIAMLLTSCDSCCCFVGHGLKARVREQTVRSWCIKQWLTARLDALQLRWSRSYG